MSQAFFLDNKTFKLVVDESAKSAEVVQTNISAFSAEQLDHAKSLGFYNETQNTISWSQISDLNLNGKEWMDIAGGLPNEFSKILNDEGAKSIFHQALGTKSPNIGKDQNNDFLVTGQASDAEGEYRRDANLKEKPKYFFAYYPLAEVGGYDYLQIVCKEYKADSSITNLTKDYDKTIPDRRDENQGEDNRTEVEKGYEAKGIKLSNVMEIKRATSRYQTGSVTKGIVQLPMTGGLSEQNNVDWGQSSLNALQTMGARMAGNTIRSVAEGDGGAAVSGILQAIKSGAENVAGIDKDTLVSYFAGQAIGVGGDLLTRGSGVALNNNLELLFKGPTLRSFAYTYNFTPRGEEEAKMVKDIIWFFKKQMRPKLGKQSIFLKSPNVFKLKYMFKDNNGEEKEHPYLNKIKMCALNGVNVNYGGGQYMTYDDGSMTQYQMQLSFSEIEPIYYDDYGETPMHGHYNDTQWEVAL